jgi:uncharacterized delta-60 repeat protein
MRGTTSFGRLVTAVAVTAAALAMWCVGAIAAPGGLDKSFGHHGKVRVNFGGSDGFDADVAVAPNRDVVLAGETSNVPDPVGGGQGYAIAVLKPNGSPDPGFSGNGRQVVQVGPEAQPFAVAVQPNGKILVAGAGGEDRQFTVIRLNEDGHLDDSFGTGGTAGFDVGTGRSYAFDLAVQKDGKIVMAGKARGTESGFDHTDFGVARLNSDGTPDDTFGQDGQELVSFGGVDYANAVAIDSHGRIDLAGQGGKKGSQMIATRLLSGGSVDKRFGSKGLVTVPFSTDTTSGASALALQKNGDLVLEGYAGGTGDNPNQVGVARLTSNGAIDRSFSDDGRQKVNFGGGGEGDGVVIQQDGRIVVGGDNEKDLGVAQLKADGSLDHSFGQKGKRTIDFGGEESYGRLALTASGKILVAGDTTKGEHDFVVAELQSH